jgi:hypothetical protein
MRQEEKMPKKKPCGTIAVLAALTLPGLPTAGPAAAAGSEPLAHVVSVTVEGKPGKYKFEVGVSSADTGCGQYADWWEVLDEDGDLLYRRVLGHSHVDEQPFVRRGGPVPVEPDQIVWVRAHMHPTGYGGTAAKGSVKEGFELFELSADFVAHLAARKPLPRSCRF